MKTRILLLSLMAFILFTAEAQIPSYVPSNGLVGWWPFNGNANDESGNGNNGTVNGATLTTDRFGLSNKAYSFNSNSINVNNNSIFDLLGGFTISAWVKTNGVAGENTIVSKYQNNDDSYSFRLSNLMPSIQIASSPANWTICQENDSIISSVWVSIVTTFDTLTNELNIYKNGMFVHQCISNSTLAISGADLVFGAFVNSAQLGGYFYGDIDDIGIWNRALSQQEITDLYNGTNANAAESNLSTANVHPNPTTGEITITSNETFLQSYSLYNSLGQLVASGMLNAENTTFSIQEFAPGIYTLQLQGEKNTTLKIVKE